MVCCGENTTGGPAMGEDLVSKVCVRCGRDCAGRPRVKDAQGRYTCGECVEELKAARAQGPAPVAATPPQPQAAAAPEVEEDGLIALEDEPLPEGLIGDGPRSCGNCGMVLGSGAVVCMGCGFNTQTGRLVSTHRPPGEGKKCTKCGYDLAGLKTSRCPECGTLNLPPRRAEQEAKAARETVRDAYLKPALMAVVGCAVAAAVTGADGGAEAVVEYAVLFAISYIVGLAVFWVCSVMWIGFDAPMHLVALQLAGVYGVTDAASSLVNLVPFLPTFIGWIIVVTVYVGLLMEVLDLELQDAVILGLVTFIVKVVIAIVIMAHLFAGV